MWRFPFIVIKNTDSCHVTLQPSLKKYHEKAKVLTCEMHLVAVRMMQRWVLLAVAGLLVHACVGRRHYPNAHHHGFKEMETTSASSPEGKIGQYEVIDAARTGLLYNAYSIHHPGRHICTNQKIVDRPVKTKQAYCKPTYRNYAIRCDGNQICKGVRLVYETHYKDVITTRNSNEVTYSCCPGWIQVTNRSHGCNKAICSKPCLNGGKCVKPEMCACLQGFSGPQCEIVSNEPTCNKVCQNGGRCFHGVCSCVKGYGGEECEIDLNAPHCVNGCENGGTCVRHEVCRCLKGFTGRYCEEDVDECKEEKPCDHICYNVPGSYKCQCKEDFILQKDGQSCRKEGNDGGFEAKDLEFEMIDKRLSKLETMMDDHKNDVSKDDIQNLYKNLNFISNDITQLKSQVTDVETYKNDMYIFKNKLNTIEKKAEKVDDLILKYDKLKKCAFYNKICL